MDTSNTSFNITTAMSPELFSVALARPVADFIKDPRELAKVELRRLCPICYNFDPFKAPSGSTSEQLSWAQAEYNIPDGTPVAKITVEKSERLREAAKNGCIYCIMVVKALGAASPGWAAEDTFIHIFLAANLPVFVHLGFGSIADIPVDREQAMQLGVDVPDGQSMSFTVRFVTHGKEAVDVEIYRPVISESQRTIGDVVFADLVQNTGFAKDIAKNAGDQQCVNFIKDNVEACVEHHKCGKSGKALPFLPDRVIWIEANNESRIQLVEPWRARARYVAVSYCWGPVGPNTFLTNADTLQARKSGIEFNDLPQLFQDVIRTARALGIEYIWIDRLCIIQGDDKDFKSQASKMGEIYGNATLAIAAASATTERDRILVPREDKWLSVDHSLNLSEVSCLITRSRRLWHRLGKEKDGGDYGRISTRAWIWQERLLAPRTVFFTPGGLKFECRYHSVWEGFNKGRIGHSWSAQLDSVTQISWTKLVEEYMGRDISRPSDRLYAIDAVMQRIQQVTKWSPFWGLWEDTLIQCLAWASKGSPRNGGPALRGGHKCRPNPGQYAPTWSWASVDGPIRYDNARPIMGRVGQTETDPMQWDPQVKIVDPASDVIRVEGKVMRIELKVTVKPNEAHEHDPTEPDKLSYDYKLSGGPKGQKGFPFVPDVALKSCSGNIGGGYVSTIVRVPYGETPPEESWNGVCFLLLVGRRKLSSLALLLGYSLRKPGALERLGIVYGLPHTGFSQSKGAVLDIV